MINRRVTMMELWQVCIILVLGVMLTLSLTGCTTAHTQFYAGQGADFASTYYALECTGGRYKEGNQSLGNMQGVIIAKVLLIGLVEGMVYLHPDNADTYYTIGAVCGYVPAAINIYTVTK